MKRSLKLGSHILHEFVLPNTWYLVFATCKQTIILAEQHVCSVVADAGVAELVAAPQSIDVICQSV